MGLYLERKSRSGPAVIGPAADVRANDGCNIHHPKRHLLTLSLTAIMVSSIRNDSLHWLPFTCFTASSRASKCTGSIVVIPCHYFQESIVNCQNKESPCVTCYLRLYFSFQHPILSLYHKTLPCMIKSKWIGELQFPTKTETFVDLFNKFAGFSRISWWQMLAICSLGHDAIQVYFKNK